MEGAAEEAVQVAKLEYQIYLDHSPESIRKIEEILRILHEQNQETPFTEKRMAKEVVLWGAYTGEVMRKLHAAHWEKDSELGGKSSFPIVFEERRQETFPVRWVHKRIVNGPDDNVWVKFQISILSDPESFEELYMNNTSESGSVEEPPQETHSENSIISN